MDRSSLPSSSVSQPASRGDFVGVELFVVRYLAGFKEGSRVSEYANAKLAFMALVVYEIW